jgi:hypothetical protein
MIYYSLFIFYNISENIKLGSEGSIILFKMVESVRHLKRLNIDVK